MAGAIDPSPNYQYLSFNILLLKILCIWDDDVSRNKLTKIKTYYLLYLVLMSCLFPVVFDFIMLLREDDLRSLLHVCIPLSCHIGTLYMLICFVKKREIIKNLLDKIDKFKEYASMDLIEIDNKANLFSKIFFLYSTMGIAMYILIPLLTKENCELHKTQNMIDHGIPCGLPDRYRFPFFRLDYLPVFEIILIHQILIVATVSYVVATLTMLLCGILYHTIQQLKHLRKMILEIHNMQDDAVINDIYLIIKYHTAIIKYSEETNEAFSSQMLLHVTLTSLIISVLCFEITFSSNTIDSIRYILHLFGWIGLLFLLCFFGQKLIDESNGVATDVYSIPWYLSSNRVQKDLRMILMRAEKPLTLNALSMGIMSLATFLKVLTSAYSYFTLFINIRK